MASALSKKIQEKLLMGLVEAADTLAEAYKRDVSVPVEYTASGVKRSDPGEFPRKETGLGQSSIGWKRVSGELAVDVGVEEDAWYMLYLEQGYGRLSVGSDGGTIFLHQDEVAQAFIDGATR